MQIDDANNGQQAGEQSAIETSHTLLWSEMNGIPITDVAPTRAKSFVIGRSFPSFCIGLCDVSMATSSLTTGAATDKQYHLIQYLYHLI